MTLVIMEGLESAASLVNNFYPFEAKKLKYLFFLYADCNCWSVSAVFLVWIIVSAYPLQYHN